jgi:hypothetical protein
MVYYQPINPAERKAAELRAGRPLPTDDDVMRFLLAERELAMREELFRKPVDIIAEVRRHG